MIMMLSTKQKECPLKVKVNVPNLRALDQHPLSDVAQMLGNVGHVLCLLGQTSRLLVLMVHTCIFHLIFKHSFHIAATGCDVNY